MAAKKKAKKKVSKKKVVAKKSKAPVVKLDKALSKKVSDFILLKRSITAANKQVKEMTSEAYKLELELMEHLEKVNQLGIVVNVGSVKIVEKDTFTAKDWKKINAWCFKHKNNDLYQRRLNTTLLNDMFKNGEKIAGVEHFVKHSLAHSKAK